MPQNTFRSLSRLGKAYVVGVTGAGAMTVVQSLLEVARQPIGWDWMILALLTLVSGSATVRIPGLPATFSVSETFVFTSVLLFGPAAGTLIVALDALVISSWASYREGQPIHKSLFNVCALPLTIWVSSHAFFLLAGPDVRPLVFSPEAANVGKLVLPLLAFTLLYFGLNSWIITFAIALERGLPAFRIWRDNFLWLSLNYLGGASVAALFVTYTRNLDLTYLAIIVPLLVVLYFTFSVSMGRVADANRHLTQLNSLYMSTIETLAMAIDAKDQITHGHIRRVQTYAVGLAKKMGVTDPGLIRAVEAAALLHDMGKLAVPEYILNKPGPLTAAEFEKMKLHASVGADILSAIDFPYPVVPIVRHHHENWDGTGYPDGLAGSGIPIGARILAVADCFDALTSDRPYRPRLADKEALRILSDRRGTMYDPLVVDTFMRVHLEIAPTTQLTESGEVLRAITEASGQHQQKPTVHRFDEISGSTEEMLTLFNLARGLSSQMALQDVGDVISKHLRRLVPSSLCAFYLYDVDTDELVAAHAAGENAGLVSGLRIGLGQRLSGWVAAHRQTIRNSDPILDFGEAARAMKPRQRSCLSTPLLVEKQLVGVLSLYSTETEAFTEEHQRVTEVVARQVAPVVSRAAETQRDRAASRDQLTGLPSLEQLRELANAHLVAGTMPHPVSLLLIDVDHFSELNSKLGRSVGDEVLENVVRATRRSLRAADLMFRYGSDEFVVLLLQTDNDTASAICSRIHDAVKLERVGDTGLPISVSVSVVTGSEAGQTVDQLIEIAVQTLRRPQRIDDPSHRPPGSIH